MIGVAAAAVAIAFVALYWLFPAGYPAAHYYVAIDADTLQVNTDRGEGQTLHVSVAESPTEIRLSITAHSWPMLPSAPLSRDVNVTVELEDALGDRRVVDNHHAVPTKSEFENPGG